MKEILESWSSSSFDNTYQDAKKQSDDFILFKNTVKRDWVTERRALDTLLSNIQTKLKTYHLTPYTPPTGLTLTDVDNSWTNLVVGEGARRQEINKNLKLMKEELRVQYSNLANGFNNDVNNLSQSLAMLDGDLQVKFNCTLFKHFLATT